MQILDTIFSTITLTLTQRWKLEKNTKDAETTHTNNGGSFINERRIIYNTQGLFSNIKSLTLFNNL